MDLLTLFVGVCAVPSCLLVVAIVRRGFACPNTIFVVFGMALLLRLTALGVVSYLPEQFVGKDWQRYQERGRILAEHWAGRGPLPPVSLEGYDYVNAAGFYVFGFRPLLMRTLNVYGSVLLCVGIFLAAWLIWRSPRAATLAGAMAAGTPSFVMWATDNDKQNLVSLLLLLFILLGIGLQRQGSLRAKLWIYAALLGVGYVLSFMGIEFIFYVAVCAVVYPFLSIRRKVRTVGMVVFLLVGAKLIGLPLPSPKSILHEKQAELFDLARASAIRDYRAAGNLAVRVQAYRTWWDVVRFLPQGTVWFLLRPYPWEMMTGKQIASVPEVMAYYGVLVLAVIEFRKMWRVDRRSALVIALPAVLIVLSRAYIQANLGSNFHHRFHVVWMFYLFAVGVFVPQVSAEGAAQLRPQGAGVPQKPVLWPALGRPDRTGVSKSLQEGARPVSRGTPATGF